MTDDVRLSVAIQAHPLRAELAAELAREIGGRTVVTLDPKPGGPASAWRCYRQCLETTPDWATHRLIIQDDAEVCREFLPTVTAAITARPERVLLLFVAGMPPEHSRQVRLACESDAPWAQLDNLRWCPAVAVVWPTGMIGELLEWVDSKNWPERFSADDEILGRFLRATSRAPLATVPSLVQHPDDVPSMLGKRHTKGADPGRVAACFIHPDTDPRAIDWT